MLFLSFYTAVLERGTQVTAEIAEWSAYSIVIENFVHSLFGTIHTIHECNVSNLVDEVFSIT